MCKSCVLVCLCFCPLPLSHGAGSPDFRAVAAKPAGKRRRPNQRGFGAARHRSAGSRRVERSKICAAPPLGTSAPGAGSPDFRAFPVKPVGKRWRPNPRVFDG